MNDLPDTVGKALGFALAVYDQTASNGGPLDRINATRSRLTALTEQEIFTPDVAAVLDGMCAGLTTYMQEVRRKETGVNRLSDYLL